MMHLTIEQIVLSVVSGGIVGFALGLIGGGGSILAVPLLLYVVGIKDAHLVIGTTAFAVAINAFINLFPHWRAGHVKWLAAVAFAVPGVVGTLVGSYLGKMMDGKALLFLFAIVMIVIAVLMIKPTRNQDQSPQRMTLRFRKVSPVGLGTGILSGFFGIGGGFLIVPGLMFATGMAMTDAIGTSLFSVGVFGLSTSVSYAASGLVDWFIVLLYIVGGVLGGFLGTKVSTVLGKSRRTLQYLFAGVILLVAIYMMVENALAYGWIK